MRREPQLPDYILRADRTYGGASRPKTLRAVRPNAGIEVAYRRKLYDLIEAMHKSAMYWVEAAYKAHTPRIAMDATPANELRDAIRKLVRQWEYNFDEGAEALAKYFATDVSERSDAALLAALRKAGFAVKFQMTREMRDILAATVNQNVALIRSIPAQYLTQVEGMVMRSVQTGRDLGQLASDLEEQLGVTRRRAALIARDQNNKASAAFTRARQIELGIEKAVWMHSHAGKKPRPTHVKMNGQEFDVKKGMWDKDEGEWILPGQLINCRCVSRPIIVGFS